MGVEKDIVESYAWYTLDAARDHPLAKENIALLTERLTDSQVELAKARAKNLRNVQPVADSTPIRGPNR